MGIDADGLLEEAWELLNRGDVAHAEGLVLRALELSPGHAHGHTLLGYCRLLGNDPRGAEESLREGMKLDPRQPLTYLLLGIAMWRMGMLDGAEAALKNALILRPDYTTGLAAYSLYLEDRGRRKEAEEIIRQWPMVRAERERVQDLLSGRMAEKLRLEDGVQGSRDDIADQLNPPAVRGFSLEARLPCLWIVWIGLTIPIATTTGTARGIFVGLFALVGLLMLGPLVRRAISDWKRR